MPFSARLIVCHDEGWIGREACEAAERGGIGTGPKLQSGERYEAQMKIVAPECKMRYENRTAGARRQSTTR